MGGSCRFEPSCSTYALEALDRHQLWRALTLIAGRLGRCRPGGGSGYDPVPPRACGHCHSVEERHAVP